MKLLRADPPLMLTRHEVAPTIPKADIGNLCLIKSYGDVWFNGWTASCGLFAIVDMMRGPLSRSYSHLLEEVLTGRHASADH